MWNPEQYERFKAERKQPFIDLLALVEPRPHMRVVDLGCGTGEFTRELHEHLGAGETLGVDNSETMLLKAGKFGGEMLRFEEGDIEAFVSERPFDLVFSNAALQWVPEHERLLARLTSFLTPHGQIAIQMPNNDSHLSHSTAADVAAEMGVEPRLDFLLPLARYAELLHELGYKRQHVRQQIYGHLLDDTRAVIEWVKGTLLTDYERRLEPAQFAELMKRYTDRLLAALGEHAPYFYTYQRVLLWGTF